MTVITLEMQYVVLRIFFFTCGAQATEICGSFQKQEIILFYPIVYFKTKLQVSLP